MAKLKPDDFTPALCKAARALIGWNAGNLADECNLSPRTVRAFESGKDVSASSRDEIRTALEAAGAEFINGGSPGVRMPSRRRNEPKV